MQRPFLFAAIQKHGKNRTSSNCETHLSVHLTHRLPDKYEFVSVTVTHRRKGKNVVIVVKNKVLVILISVGRSLLQ